LKFVISHDLCAMVLLTRIAMIRAARPTMAIMLKAYEAKPGPDTVVVSTVVAARAVVSVVAMTCVTVVEGGGAVCSEAAVDVMVDGCVVTTMKDFDELVVPLCAESPSQEAVTLQDPVASGV